MPGLARDRRPLRAGGVDRRGRRRGRRARRDGPPGHPRLPRRGHPRRGAGRRHRGGVPRAARRARRARPGRRGRGLGEAVRGRPGAARRAARRWRARTPARSAGAARNAGTTVTLDMEDHTTTDSTLRVLRELRKDFPETGAVLQAYLRRTEDGLPRPGHRGVAGAAVQGRLQGARVGRLPVPARGRPVLRALPEDAHGGRRLPDGRQPRPADGRDRRRAGRAAPAGTPDSYEYQMLYGIRPDEQRRLVGARAARCASTCPTVRSGTATSCAGSPSGRATSASSLRSLISKK